MNVQIVGQNLIKQSNKYYTSKYIYSALSILRYILLYRNASYYDTKSVFQTLPNYRNLYWLY